MFFFFPYPHVQEAYDDCEMAVKFSYPKENILKVLFRLAACSAELRDRNLLQKDIKSIENELKNHKNHNPHIKKCRISPNYKFFIRGGISLLIHFWPFQWWSTKLSCRIWRNLSRNSSNSKNCHRRILLSKLNYRYFFIRSSIATGSGIKGAISLSDSLQYSNGKSRTAAGDLLKSQMAHKIFLHSVFRAIFFIFIKLSWNSLKVFIKIAKRYFGSIMFLLDTNSLFSCMH